MTDTLQIPRGETHGTMPATPVTGAAPGCDRCTWVTVAAGHARLKMVSGSCSEHAAGAVRWDYERWLWWYPLTPSGRVAWRGEPGRLVLIA